MNSIPDAVDSNLVHALSYQPGVFRAGQVNDQRSQPQQNEDPKLSGQVNPGPGMHGNAGSSNSQAGGASGPGNGSGTPETAKEDAQNALVAVSRYTNSNKFGAKKKSWVWNWFVQDDLDLNVAICDQCGKCIRRLASDKGSPKKLSEHLRTHRIDRETVNPNRESMMSVEANVSGSSMAYSPQVPLRRNLTQGGYASLPRHILNEFEIAPYTQVKFHKELMKFLAENKLPITVVKSATFRQIVFTLRPESIPDLDDLDNIYASFIEVFKNAGTRPAEEWL
ncbi:unnamed protein product [Kuraishia capsulata CBS 1993]|uniref:BED-type domain-containing protein n=1 Tax=Kuraishia capsulata CBS 1993 TaxID=1382522 RepID=W6MGI3_9ASCO|nr:uncharacterized protein KUCA_T00001191001 [Kuraishia capsulata CBS 1993]CDK25224.1 unnamed protein product [Kuraishia capsulata CBS 1993]